MLIAYCLLPPSYALVLEELKEAVENMKLVADGKLKPRPAEELLNANLLIYTMENNDKSLFDVTP